MPTTTTVLDRMIRGGRAVRAAVTVNGSENFTVSRKAWQGFDGGRGGEIRLVGNRSATYEELYRTQPWVYAIVNRYARSIARLPLKVFVDAERPGERGRVREGPLAELLQEPAEGEAPFGWKEAIVTNLMVHGNCVVPKVRRRAGLPPSELPVTSFAYWSVRREGGSTWYVFAPGGGLPIVRFQPDEVVHFRWWRAGNGLVAQSPIEALARTLEMEDAAQRHAIASFENGARPVGAYVVEGALKRDAFERGREQLRELYGGVDNAFKIALLEGNVKWQPMSHTLVESELVNLRKLTREEVAAAYNIPPPVVGILDRATFANITEQHLMEYVDSMQPVTTMIEETLQVQLVRREPTMEGQYVEFDYGAVLAGDPVKQLAVLVRATGRPIMTANEARERLNLPPVDDGDELVTTNNMIGGRIRGVDDDDEAA